MRRGVSSFDRVIKERGNREWVVRNEVGNVVRTHQRGWSWTTLSPIKFPIKFPRSSSAAEGPAARERMGGLAGWTTQAQQKEVGPLARSRATFLD